MQELKDVIRAAIGLSKVIGYSLEDGKIDISDAASIFSAMPVLGKAVDGISKVPAELNSMDEQSKTDLVDFFKSELSLDDENLESLIERIFSVIADIALIVTEVTRRPKID